MITLDKQDNVFILRLQDNENRFNFDSLARIHEMLDKVEAAPDPIALVTVGEGKFYSNGLDLDWMSKSGTDQAFENVRRVHVLLARMLAFPCVTVAAINGHAFAAGAMFALTHDYRIMRSDRGYFCLPEVDLGMAFTPPMESLITARMSKAAAHESMITGRRYTSAEAVAASIAHKSVADAEVLPTSIALAQSLAKPNRKTLGLIKASLYAPTLALIAAERAQTAAIRTQN